ncbi:MAG: phosphodiester glycosidase family protein [Fimbriimonadaceae bacterium]
MRKLLLPAVVFGVVLSGPPSYALPVLEQQDKATLAAGSEPLKIPAKGEPATPKKPAAAAIAYQKFKSGRFWYHSVKADMNSPMLAAETIHANNLRNVWKLIAKRQPIAAITGTFFAPRQQKPIADVLVNGKLKVSGSRGTAFGVGWDGGVKIFDQAFGQKTDWLEYQFGLRGAIRLIKNGIVNPNPKWQKFRDKRLWGRAARTGVGLTKTGKLLFVATRSSVTLTELGKAMRSRGVVEAISLDGGTSTCLYFNGKMVISPGRRLCNLVVISLRSGTSAADAAPARLGAIGKR